jgi:16S rRNA (uracil1498-N3)-methyltransferase
MVLPLFHLDITDVPAVGSTVTLTGSEAKHAATVRRMRQGEGIQLSNGRGLRIIGVVAAVEPAAVALTVTEASVEEIPKPELVLVQALAKGDRDELAIQAATELGVSGVIPWQAERSISRWDGPKVAKGVERWQSIVAEAAKQALRAHTPSVGQPQTTKQLAASFGNGRLALVLDPTASRAITQVEIPTDGQLLVCVGPEGGISDSELSVLESAGAVRVRLGSEILRTSTAGMAAISVLQAKLGRW